MATRFRFFVGTKMPIYGAGTESGVGVIEIGWQLGSAKRQFCRSRSAPSALVNCPGIGLPYSFNDR